MVSHAWGKRVGRANEGAGQLLGKGNFQRVMALQSGETRPWTEETKRAEVPGVRRRKKDKQEQAGYLFWGTGEEKEMRMFR